MSFPQAVSGDHSGIDFPVTVESFLADGAAFLTCALHHTGVLPADNRVAEIVSSREFHGGGMGRKLIVELAYATPSPALPVELFIKFPREFGDPLRDLFNPVMASEVNFALLSRQEGFPVRVAQCYFADSNLETQCHILITECIHYGEGQVEPHRDKCLDYLIENPLPYYEALASALGRLAGSHKSGKLGAGIDQQFPFAGIDSVGAIPFDRQGLQDKLDKLQQFMADCPRLFPEACRDEQFFADFSAAMFACFDAQGAIRHYLTSKPDMIALCHWNANIDNGWFWRDDNNQLQAGLLDWGSAGQMNLAQAFFGMTCAAEPEFLANHRAELMMIMLDEYQDCSGMTISPDEFKRCLILATSILGMAWMLDAPSIIEAELGGVVKEFAGRFDSRLVNHFLARAQLHLLTVFLADTDPAEIHKALEGI